MSVLYACLTVIYDFLECICLPCNAQVQVFNYTKYHKFMYIIQVKGLEDMFTFHLFWFLISGYEMSPDEGQEEYEEVQADLKKREEEVSRY